MIYLSGSTRHPDIYSLQWCLPAIHSHKTHFLSLHFSSTFIVHETFLAKFTPFQMSPNFGLARLVYLCSRANSQWTWEQRLQLPSIPKARVILKMGVHPQLATQIAHFSCTPLQMQPFILTLETVVYVCVKVTTLWKQKSSNGTLSWTSKGHKRVQIGNSPEEALVF